MTVAELPYAPTLSGTGIPVASRVRRNFAGSRSFTWAAGFAWVCLSVAWDLLRAQVQWRAP